LAGFCFIQKLDILGLMLQSKLFPKTLKEAPKDEVSRNAELLIRAGFINKLQAGVYTLLPLGLRTVKKITDIVREEMEAINGQEILMPVLQPKANWEATGRWDSLEVLFKFISPNTKIEMALGPTHEEVVTPLADRNLSYQDLPFYLYQIQTKFRDEARAKSGMMRGREFGMKDLYSFHVDEADLDAYYEKATEAYHKVFSRLGLGDQTFLTFASGGTFSKYSHEFQTLTSAGEDLIHLCRACKLAVNDEIFGEQSTCPKCGGALTPEKAAEVGNIFKLKTKYTDAFNLKYKAADGTSKPVVMGCYGIGITRLLGVVAETLSDDKGLVWPSNISPFAVHLISLGAPNEGVNKMIEEAKSSLESAGYDVLIDDRQDKSAGEKFADADLIGCTIRLVLSERLLATQEVEIKLRNQKEAIKVSAGDLVASLRKLGV
jgi:prolyl-tRNA synthetase